LALIGVEWYVLPSVCTYSCLRHKRVIVQCLVKQHGIPEPLRNEEQTVLFKDSGRNHLGYKNQSICYMGQSLDIRVQGVTQMRSDRRDQDPAKDGPPTPTSLHRCREGLRYPKCDHLRLASVGAIVRDSKRPTTMQALPALRTHAA